MIPILFFSRGHPTSWFPRTAPAGVSSQRPRAGLPDARRHPQSSASARGKAVRVGAFGLPRHRLANSYFRETRASRPLACCICCLFTTQHDSLSMAQTYTPCLLSSSKVYHTAASTKLLLPGLNFHASQLRHQLVSLTSWHPTLGRFVVLMMWSG